jgi:AcrR family transcriptional regulator
MANDRRPTRRATTPDLETIIDTAARLFHERGFQNTSMQDLADVLGIAKPTLYTHAKGKLEILGEIFDRVLAQVDAATAEAAAKDDPVEGLRVLVQGHTRVAVTHRAHYGVFHGDQRELPAPLRRKYHAWARNYVEAIRALIQRGQDAGALRADLDALVVAYAVIGTTNWTARWLHPSGRLSAPAAAADFVDLLLGGLAAEPHPRRRSTVEEEEIHTISFGLDGVGYEIDLSRDEAAAFRDAIARYVAAGRTISAPRRPHAPDLSAAAGAGSSVPET